MADFPAPFLYTSSSEIPTLSYTRTVADPELHLRGPRSSSPWNKGEWGGSRKIFFRPLGPHFGLKIRGAGSPRPPWIRHYRSLKKIFPSGGASVGKVKDCNSNIFLLWLSISYTVVLIMSKTNKHKTKLEKYSGGEDRSKISDGLVKWTILV